jgi:hypothetical protein
MLALRLTQTGTRIMNTAAIRSPLLAGRIPLARTLFVPRRGRVKQEASQPGRKLTAKEKQDMRRRARM